jgi:O-antigen/teichoic acid export membrane protein
LTKADDLVRGRNLRLAMGSLSGLIGRALSLLAPLIVMPAMLVHLGEIGFGVWMTSTAIVAIAGFTDLGLGSGLNTRIGAAMGSGDLAGMRRDIANTYAMITLVAVVLAVITALGLGLGGLWLPDMAEGSAMPIVAATLGCFIVSLPAMLGYRVMFARQDGVWSHLCLVLGAALSIALTLLTIAAGGAPWLAVLAYAMPSNIVAGLATLWYFRRHAGIAPRASDIAATPAREVLTLGLRFLGLSVLTATALNADALIIALRLGPEAVTQFAVPARLASLLGLIVSYLFLPLWPANAEALARGDWGWVMRTTRTMSWLGAAAVGLAGIVLIALADPLIALWMSRGFADQQAVVAAFSAFTLLTAMTAPYAMVLNSRGAVRPQIIAWAIFLTLTVSGKALAVGTAPLWVVPLISAAIYAGVVLPLLRRAVTSLYREANAS